MSWENQLKINYFITFYFNFSISKTIQQSSKSNEKTKKKKQLIDWDNRVKISEILDWSFRLDSGLMGIQYIAFKHRY